MSVIKTDIDGLNPVEQIARGDEIIAVVRANASLTAEQKAALVAPVAEANARVQAALDARYRADSAMVMALDEQSQATTNWKDAVSAMALDVSMMARGDAMIIVENGFAVAKSKHVRKPEPGPVRNLRGCAGEFPGTVWVRWQGESAASRYALQLCQCENSAHIVWLNGPAMAGRTTKFLLEGLQSRMLYWVRVQALNTHKGAWSGPISIVAP